MTHHEWYSYSLTLGGNIYGWFTYYLMSPLNLLFLITPRSGLNNTIVLITLIKIGLLGLTMCLFLVRQNFALHGQEPSNWVKVVFSSLYALNSFFVAFSFHLMWMDAMIMLPLVILGLDVLIKNGRKRYFVIALAITIILNYYIAFMVGAFSCIWLLFRSEEGLSSKIIQTVKKFSYSVVFSLLLSAVVWLPTLISLRGIKKASLHELLKLGVSFNPFLGFGRSFLNGAYATNMPNGTSGAPLIYCSNLVILLVILFFFMKAFSKRLRYVAAAIIVFMGLSTFISPLMILWHGGTAPLGFNPRFSFVILFFLIYLAMKAWANLDKKQNFLPLLIFDVLFVLATLAYRLRVSTLLNTKNMLLNIGLLILNTCLLLLITQQMKKYQPLLEALVLLIAIGDIGLNTRHIFQNNYNEPTTTTFDHYKQQVGSVVNKIPRLTRQNNRIEMQFSRTNNDALLLNYPGLTHYSSSENDSVKWLMQSLGYYQYYKWTNYSNGSTAFSDSYFGISNVVTDPNHSLDQTLAQNSYMGHIQSNDIGNSYLKPSKRYSNQQLAVLHNNNSLPIAFPLKRNNTNQIIQASTSPFSNQNILSKGLLNTSILNQAVVSKVSNDKTTAQYQVIPNRDGEIYLFVQATGYSNAFNYEPITIQREDSSKVITDFNFGENGVIDLGAGQQGKKVSFKIANISPNLKLTKIQVASLMDEKHFSQQMNAVQEKVKAQKVAGNNVNVQMVGQKRQTAILTLPYDKGWHATINGKKVKIEKAYGSLMKVKLSRTGLNHLKFMFIPRGFIEGAVLSSISFVLLISFMVVKGSRKRVNKI